MWRAWRSVRMASTTSTRSIPKDPLITIIGATGTGKSQLAVEIAKRFNGEVINGDAMQLYAGLPIITNKVTEEEKQGIPHHLLGCIGLKEPTWVVSTFVGKAVQAITDIRARGKLPILVGGTHYYTQSLLFNESLTSKDDTDTKMDTESTSEERYPILAKPTDVILEELRKVDPAMAAKWHPNDRRKIQRSLMIYLESGKPASEVYAMQQAARAQSDHSSQQLLRFPTLLFWTHSTTEALHQRLNQRVDSMLEKGLLDEVT